MTTSTVKLILKYTVGAPVLLQYSLELNANVSMLTMLSNNANMLMLRRFANIC